MERWNEDKDRSFDNYLKAFYEQFHPISHERINNKDWRHKHYLSHPLCHLTQDLIKNIVASAQRILKKTTQGDDIVIFGNTSYYIGRVLERLVSNDKIDDNYRRLIFFPFSGSPNSDDRNDALVELVTPKRLEHLKKRLKKASLLPDSYDDLLRKKIYFVDRVCIGRGLHYTISVIRDHYNLQKIDKLPFHINK